MPSNHTKFKIVNIISTGLDSNINRPYVISRSTDLNFSDKQEIVWVTVPPDVPFTVRFKNDKGSPFGDSVFTQDNPKSGPIKNYDTKSDEDEFYPYEVEIDGHIIDPGVLIWD